MSEDGYKRDQLIAIVGGFQYISSEVIKHLDFLKDLKELFKKHEVEEVYFSETTLWVEFKTPIDDIDFWSVIDNECLDKKIKDLEEHIQDETPISLNPESFVAIPEVWGNTVPVGNESVLSKMAIRRAVVDVEKALEEIGPVRQFFEKWVDMIKAGPKPQHYAMRLGDFLNAMEADGGATNVPQIRAEIIRKMGEGFFDTLVWITDARHQITEEDKHKVREKLVEASGKSIPMELTIQFTPLTQVNKDD